MKYRTKTYIAGDWTGDKDLIDQIYLWNESNYWSLDFVDAHDLKQARDSSLPCSIKKSLAERLEVSKTFVLIVGNHTKQVTKGGCQHCSSYNSWNQYCVRGYHVDYRSYIEYECVKALRDNLKIVVIYNSAKVHREKCPGILRVIGDHINGYYIGEDGKFRWNYQGIKEAIISS